MKHDISVLRDLQLPGSGTGRRATVCCQYSDGRRASRQPWRNRRFRSLLKRPIRSDSRNHEGVHIVSPVIEPELNCPFISPASWKETPAFWGGGHLPMESCMVQFAKTQSAAAFVTASLWHWQSISVSGHGPAGPLCTTQLNWKLSTTCAHVFRVSGEK